MLPTQVVVTFILLIKAKQSLRNYFLPGLKAKRVRSRLGCVRGPPDGCRTNPDGPGRPRRVPKGCQGPRWPPQAASVTRAGAVSTSARQPYELRSGHQRQKGLEGSAADPPVRWRGGDSFLWPVTSRERPSPTVATADPRRPRDTKRDGRRPVRREPRDKWLRRDAVSHKSRVFAARFGGTAPL